MRAGEHVEKELRRSRSTLRTLGGGVILFTLWDLLKPLLLTLLVSEETGELQTQSGAEAFSFDMLADGVLILLLLAFLLLTAMIPILRIWIGRCAMAEGLGKKKGAAYMCVAFVFAAGQLLIFTAAVIFLLVSDLARPEDPLRTIATLLVELSSLVTMAETALTARRVRKLERLLREAE